MHFSAALLTPLLASAVFVHAGYTPASTIATDFLAGTALVNLAIDEITQTFTGKNKGTCTLANASIRREWYGSPIVPDLKHNF
jgi:hypothetical protein